MKKCVADAHPYCTCRVASGESVCAAGHPQQIASDPSEILDSWALDPDPIPTTPSELPSSNPLHLHFSGYDPRAAGGRQTIKLELCGVLAESVVQLDVQLHSDLIRTGQSQHCFRRAASGQWRPLLIEFSSKDKEHGQYPMEVALSHALTDTQKRRWTCTAVILVPRPDATLTEIHRVFLGAQKNIKVSADDGAIAKLSGLNNYGDIEISATNAAIAQLDMDAPIGKYDVGLGTIAWDEELIEDPMAEIPDESILTVQPSAPIANFSTSPSSSQSTHCATLTSETPQAGRKIHMFALEQWVLGRFELHHPGADILLAHRGSSEAENAKLTRRISAQHAIIRRTDTGFEIVDVSRYGILLDGLSMEKDTPVPLRIGMHIEFCASIRSIVCLQVVAIQAHLVILERSDAGGHQEFFYLLQPETRPDNLAKNMLRDLPQLFHYQENFWSLDGCTAQEMTESPLRSKLK